jgi:hypothetical protein
MRRLGSLARERPALAAASALFLALIGVLAVAVLAGQDTQRERSAGTGQVSGGGPAATSDGSSERAGAPDVSDGAPRGEAAQAGGAGGRSDPVRPEPPDSRASPTAYRGQTMVPDHLVGQRGEVSREDLRLSGLRGRIAGPEDAPVCAAQPSQSSLVAKGSTVVLRTRC